MMGNIASQIADIVVITFDNPRLEDSCYYCTRYCVVGVPEKSHHKIVQELDRKKAIELAYHLQITDLLLFLWQRPDEYQIVGTTKHYFSERQIVEHLLICGMRLIKIKPTISTKDVTPRCSLKVVISSSVDCPSDKIWFCYFCFISRK